MNWLNSLLGKAPAPAVRSGREPPKRTVAPSPVPTAAAIEALRRAVAAAADAAQQQSAERALGSALGAAGQVPLDSDAAGVWVAAIAQAADKSLATHWLQKLTTDETLAAVACDGRFAEVRLAAAQRIGDSTCLEHVARASKNKDKGVYRHCSEVLRQRREGAERARLAAALSQDLHQLLSRAPVSVSHLLELERAFKALEAGTTAPDEALADCRALLADANARVLDESQYQRQLQALLSTACALTAELDTAASEPSVPYAAAATERHGVLVASLGALPPWLGTLPAARTLAQMLPEIAQRLNALATDAERLAAALRVLDAAATTPGDTQWTAAWEALPMPQNAQAQRELQARWLALQAPAAPAPEAADHGPAALDATVPEPEPEAPAPAARSVPAFDREAVRALIDNLEQAIEDGQLGRAEAAAKHIKSTLGTQALEGRLDGRLQRAQARLASLRGWAQWGATKKREDLIEAAAQLQAAVQGATHDVEHLAVAIPALREEWRRLNTQGPTSKAQWEGFDNALTQAYQPVAAQRAEEAQRRAQARGAREALLASFEAAIDAPQAEAAASENLREQMLAQWRAGPFAGYRDERALRARFDALLLTLEERVQALRGAEIDRREALIAAVEALRELPDLRLATTQAKTLQERWRVEAGAIRLRRGEEQKLWQRFRGGCDAVFARRDAERDAEKSRREQHQQDMGARLDHFATLLQSADAPALRSALAQFRGDWEAQAAAGGDATEASGVLQRRARELQRLAQQRVESLEQQSIREHYARLAAAAAPTDGLDAAALERAAAGRQALLLDLELLLGLSSPAASAEARRRRQLEQLQNRFRPGAAQAPTEHDPEKMLRQWYALPALADADLDSRIAAVVDKLLQRRLAALQAKNEAGAAVRPREGQRTGPRAPSAAAGRRPGRPAGPMA